MVGKLLIPPTLPISYLHLIYQPSPFVSTHLFPTSPLTDNTSFVISLLELPGPIFPVVLCPPPPVSAGVIHNFNKQAQTLRSEMEVTLRMKLVRIRISKINTCSYHYFYLAGEDDRKINFTRKREQLQG